jgi:hypothetical protein
MIHYVSVKYVHAEDIDALQLAMYPSQANLHTTMIINPVMESLIKFPDHGQLTIMKDTTVPN